ncbi:hypothetical protein [Ensifer canadensis]
MDLKGKTVGVEGRTIRLPRNAECCVAAPERQRFGHQKGNTQFCRIGRERIDARQFFKRADIERCTGGQHVEGQEKAWVHQNTESHETHQNHN